MLLELFSYKTTKIAKYISRNLVTYFFAITFIIGLVVFGNQFVLTVQESIDRGIPFQELMPLISFNMIRDVPVILVLSIFLASIISNTCLQILLWFFRLNPPTPSPDIANCFCE